MVRGGLLGGDRATVWVLVAFERFPHYGCNDCV